MKKNLSILFIAGVLVLASCSKMEDPQDYSPILKSAEPGLSATDQQDYTSQLKKGPAVMNFRAHLSGGQEVPPNESIATGQAIFQLGKDGETLSYRLIVANIENVTMAHIHQAEVGENGPVIVWLYPSSPPAVPIPGKTNGILQQGVITKDNLVGQLSGMEMSDLIGLMVSGQTYVNVHTSQFPPGEIRGQIW